MFKWSNYPIEFLQKVLVKETANDEAASKRLEYFWDNIETLSGMLSYVHTEPDFDFVKTHRVLIEQELLVQNEEVLKDACRKAKVSGRSLNERYKSLFSKPLSHTLINIYREAIYIIGGKKITYDENSKFQHTIPIDMKLTPFEDVPLHDYQKEAVEKLRTHFKTNDAGLLVMPTGSGKTRTADYYVIHDMISQGYQVLWLCHRHMLINQAANGFYNFAGLAKDLNPNIKKYNISCISGEHLKASAIGKDTVIVASNMSLWRNVDYLKNMLGNKVMLVVDECHHSTATTFKNIIKYVRKHRKNTKLLGLTATPIRMGEKETRELFSIYDDTIIHTVKMADLIARGILAFPEPKRVSTSESFEAYIDIDDEKFIKKYGEISPKLADRIASSNSRNKIIVKEYLENRDKYGKTLIFAINQLHCRLLKEEFVKAGINCDDIYSGKENNSEVISRYKNNKIDVLINVNILTEGSDVPDIQTVFLCRPTQSEGLLLQCIGRGMRGIEAHGTEKLYVVDFYDQWEIFNKWLNPEFLIEGELSGETEKIMESVKVETIQYEWELCQDLYAHMVTGAYKVGEYIAIPSAWFSISNDNSSDSRRILVFENQLNAYREFFSDMKSWTNTTDMQYLLDKYFSGDIERPSCDELKAIVDYVSINGYKPELHSVINRKQIEPLEIIRRAKEEGVDYIELATQTYESNSTAKDLFDTLDKYLDHVRFAKECKGFNLPLGSKVEELPFEFIPFDRTPYYDLQDLYQQVLNERSEVSQYINKDIDWSDIPYADAFGKNFIDGRIRINRILNSKDVPKEVIKFLIYHELLHEKHRNHGKIFRELEHRYPGYEKWDNFLDGKFPYFLIRNEG